MISRLIYPSTTTSGSETEKAFSGDLELFIVMNGVFFFFSFLPVITFRFRASVWIRGMWDVGVLDALVLLEGAIAAKHVLLETGDGHVPTAFVAHHHLGLFDRLVLVFLGQVLFERSFVTERLVAVLALVLRRCVLVLHVLGQGAGMEQLSALRTSHAIVAQVVMATEFRSRKKKKRPIKKEFL